MNYFSFKKQLKKASSKDYLVKLKGLQLVPYSTYCALKTKSRLVFVFSLILVALAFLAISLYFPYQGYERIEATSYDYTFTVDGNLDSDDNNGADDICMTDDGVCTLRAAISQACSNFPGNSASKTKLIDATGISGTVTLGGGLYLTDAVCSNTTIIGPGMDDWILDFNDEEGSTGFTIWGVADNVTISYLTIYQTGGQGIYVADGSDNHTFDHLKIHDIGTSNAIDIYGDDITVTNCNIYNTTTCGINISDGGTATLISGNTITSTTSGIFINSGGAVTTISNNTISDPSGLGNGITIFDTSNAMTISGNTISGFTDANTAAIASSGASNIAITNNNLSGNYYGVRLVNSSTTNTIASNTISSSTADGISMDASTGNTIGGSGAEGNTITNSGQHGIYLQTSANSNAISYNVITDSGEDGQDGIALSASSSNTISYNTIGAEDAGCGQDGISLALASNSNNISNNTIHYNNQYGININASDSNTFSSNTINNNGAGTPSTVANYTHTVFSYNDIPYNADPEALMGNPCSGAGLLAYGKSSFDAWIYVCPTSINTSQAGTLYSDAQTAGGFDFSLVTLAGSKYQIFWVKDGFADRGALDTALFNAAGGSAEAFIPNALTWDGSTWTWDTNWESNLETADVGATVALYTGYTDYPAITLTEEYAYADIYLSSSDGNTFSGETLSTSDNGVKLDGDSTGNTITDSVISDSVGYDITSSSTGSNTFDNTTYSSQSISAGTVDFDYDVIVHLLDSGSNNISSATVSVNDKDDTTIDLGTTDASGLTTEHESLNAYQITSSGISNTNTFSATHEDYINGTATQTTTLNTKDQEVTFTIDQTLALTSPNGGETFYGDDAETITWTFNGVISNVKLEYSTDGSNYTTIVASTTNDGSYDWTVVNINSSNVTLRISNVADAEVNDTTDEAFNIESISRGSSTAPAAPSPADQGETETEESGEEEPTLEEEQQTPAEESTPTEEQTPVEEQTPPEEIPPVISNSQPQAGDLIKARGYDTIYLLDQDQQRHAFLNASMFFSWYDDFSLVKEIPITTLVQYPLGSNMTYHPGSLIKVPSSSRVYLVTSPNILRWIISEEVFYALGYDFDQVYDLLESSFADYQLGTDITTAEQTVQVLGATTEQTNLVFYLLAAVILLFLGLGLWLVVR